MKIFKSRRIKTHLLFYYNLSILKLVFSRNLFRGISVLKIFSRDIKFSRKNNFREISILKLLLSRNLFRGISILKKISREQKRFTRILNSQTFALEKSQFSNLCSRYLFLEKKNVPGIFSQN